MRKNISRRDFLKGAGIGALGIAAAGTIVATVAYAAKKPKDRKNKDFCDDYFNYMEEVTEDAE